ncbi:hypothetical protein BJ322DRAFT_1072911 [Thelephora terrestris]|uniref:STB6-like N-terminal domain-containing protein n=1 Tax=Thelephora terrestris TaxID=56493 RepID=A0A9P6HAD1_9AGAM|nr:hypothetical protein BJ322DRAFT_1072911 [Thelephora terrestris]
MQHSTSAPPSPSHRHGHQTPSRMPVSQTPSPYLSPQPSGFMQPYLGVTRRRLLIPTVRRSSDGNSPKFGSKPASRLARSTSGSASHHSSPDPGSIQRPPTLVGKEWIGAECRFEVLEEFELEGYQIYAVEKWVVERTRPITVLTVYTGDPKHKIAVTALSPTPSLMHHEAQVEWEKALQVLRRDGARPKETDRGTLMVTSLANFRSDFTIVQIPDGNYLHAREQLWTNINLLRMGCSGRSALTLQKPGETTIDRFVSMYNFPDKIRCGDLFNATVLGLVKAVQASLAIFGMFDLNYERNGLLCDITVDGIQKWITEIGEPHLHVEPMERVADPTIVSALLSLVFTMRNKLHDLGQLVPRDPFLEPRGFVNSLTVFHYTSRNHSHPLPEPSSNIALIEAIDAAHDRFKQSEPFKVHRVLKSKIGDLTTDLRTATNQNHSGSNMETTSNLSLFVTGVLSRGKDVSASLQYLWSGRVLDLKTRRVGWTSDGEREEDLEVTKSDGKSTDEEHELPSGIHWSGRVQRKIGSWTALGRAKKMSVDISGRAWPWTHPAETAQETHTPVGPTVVITSGEDDYALSSGQVSPIWEHPTTASSSAFDRLHSAIPTAASSSVNISEYDRKLNEFDQKRSQKRNPAHRIVTWSDPKSIHGNFGRTESSSDGYGTETTWGDSHEVPFGGGENWTRKRLINSQLQRRRSFADVNRLKGTRVLPIERMKIDVELCGQLLIMHRRENHLQNMIKCMEQLCYTLSETNSTLRDEYQEHNEKLSPFLSRGSVISEVESIRLKADSMAQETKALQYESAQFRPEYLWSIAEPARRRTLELREKVFGTGRRLPPGVSGAHGQFNRLQWTLDGQGRLVDSFGKDESEVEEELALGDLVQFLEGGEEEDEEDVVQHPSLKPTWLLKFFTSWGARWGASAAILKKNDDTATAQATPIGTMTPRAQSPVPTPSPTPLGLQARK